MDFSQFRALIPINSLASASVDELLANTTFEHFPVWRRLFAEGDPVGPYLLYLLEGEVVLSTRDGRPAHSIIGGTEDARNPLGHINPRPFTCIARTPVLVARVDGLLLKQLRARQKTDSYEVSEIDAGEHADWVMELMNRGVFKKLPAAKISAMLERFSPISVKAGQVIIRQGNAGDCYYLIKDGKADVLRYSNKTHKVEVVDQIGEGEGFGEDALLSGFPRNATVVMATDGLLLRLGQEDFNDLLRAPVVKWVGLEQAQVKVRDGACLLDVRWEDEFAKGSIEGSINLPLQRLRAESAGLDREREYIVFCQNGKQSCTAAFILINQGFKVSVLREGLEDVKPC